jgi:hypothetical protein
MHRIIKIDNTSYRADIGALNNCRVTIKDGEITVSPDLTGRTPGAKFEAVFYGRERVEPLTVPAPDQESGNDRYRIDPLELDEDETPLTLAKRAKLCGIAAERWRAETGGITFSGMTIDTSRESQALITGAALQATIDSAYTCRWKTAQGFVELTTEMVLAVAVAVRQHVQACFDREAELSEAVDAAETMEAVQAISWDEE